MISKKFVALAAATVMSATMAITGTASARLCPDDATNPDATTIGECYIEKDQTLMGTTSNIINVIIGVLAIVAVFFIVMGGVNFTTSQGDPAKVKKAKDTVLYAVIGLVVAILAYAIVNFVLKAGFGGGSAGGSI